MSSDYKKVAPLVIPADPWLWERLDSDAWQELCFKSHDFGPTSPVGQYEAVMRCKAERLAVEKGDGFAVLACVRTCGTSGLTMPDWLVSAFNRRYDAVLNCRALSWDDPLAFGSPYPKSTNLNAIKKRRTGRTRMWLAVVHAVQNGESVNFERLGKPHGYGKTLAEEFYREAISRLGLYDPVQARRDAKTAKQDSAMHIFSLSAIARESGSELVDIGIGAPLLYQNPGPTREAVVIAATTIKKPKQPATSPKAASLRKRSP